MSLHVDDIDAQIIKTLNLNGRTPNTEIAKKLKLSETAIRKRIRKLLDDEVIQIVAVVNQEKMGYMFRGKINHGQRQQNDTNEKRKNQCIERELGLICI